jgi:hypothetical protein
MSRISWVCSECGRSNSPDLATCICTGSSEHESKEKRDFKEEAKDRVLEEVQKRSGLPIKGILKTATSALGFLGKAKVALPIVGLLGGGLLLWNTFKPSPPLPDFTEEIAALGDTIAERDKRIEKLLEELDNIPIPEPQPARIVRVRVPITDTAAVKAQLDTLHRVIDFYEEQYPIALKRIDKLTAVKDSLLDVNAAHIRRDLFQDKQLDVYRASLGRTRRELWLTRAATVAAVACIAWNEGWMGLGGESGSGSPLEFGRISANVASIRF